MGGIQKEKHFVFLNLGMIMPGVVETVWSDWTKGCDAHKVCVIQGASLSPSSWPWPLCSDSLESLLGYAWKGGTKEGLANRHKTGSGAKS